MLSQGKLIPQIGKVTQYSEAKNVVISPEKYCKPVKENGSSRSKPDV
jgi:hypothetical protein